MTVVAPSGRFPPAVVGAAYFVIADGLTNVTRYADASEARMEIRALRETLTVSVRDDDRGGTMIQASLPLT